MASHLLKRRRPELATVKTCLCGEFVIMKADDSWPAISPDGRRLLSSREGLLTHA